MTDRQECIVLNDVKSSFRILHISDVHFSIHTTHEKNQQIISELLRKADFYSPLSQHNGIIAVTGDLVSRKIGETSISDALDLLSRLKQIAPVAYSLGNHEKDLPDSVLADMLRKCRKAGILVLDNSSVMIQEILFTGLTLPQSVYKNQNGSYLALDEITPDMISSCIGTCPAHPCVLLAHSPMGFEAYAQWGADVVLSGHVHGGIIRIPCGVGMLSPERRFFPKYTKGIYQHENCFMNVSAGIGKFRLNNPPEFVCIDLIPQKS
ncbi:MAG: metallophosphoesterase [Oscillospiraceae bacterium]|nr:metallophosphoesterase [Oscillospiraceae bacterium]